MFVTLSSKYHSANFDKIYWRDSLDFAKDNRIIFVVKILLEGCTIRDESQYVFYSQ